MIEPSVIRDRLLFLDERLDDPDVLESPAAQAIIAARIEELEWVLKQLPRTELERTTVDDNIIEFAERNDY